MKSRCAIGQRETHDTETYLVSEPNLRLNLDRALHLAGLWYRDRVPWRTTIFGGRLAVEQRLLLPRALLGGVYHLRRTFIQVGDVSPNRGGYRFKTRHGKCASDWFEEKVKTKSVGRGTGTVAESLW